MTRAQLIDEYVTKAGTRVPVDHYYVSEEDLCEDRLIDTPLPSLILHTTHDLVVSAGQGIPVNTFYHSGAYQVIFSDGGPVDLNRWLSTITGVAESMDRPCIPRWAEHYTYEGMHALTVICDEV